MINEFLFHEEEASKDEKSNYVNLKIEIRQLLKDDFNRRVLSEVLLDLRKDVAGDTQKRLFKLYQDLDLQNDDFKKLKNWRWEIVSRAILNLTQMQVAEAYSFVTKFINDKRHTIRKQAEIAVVTLKPEGINYFLDTTKFKISEWQQLKLMDALRYDSDYQAPRFKAWLTSTNRHVVLFALRLIKYYIQNDADAALIELVRHKNTQIKEEAIACIKEFHIVDALPTLKLVFWKSSTDVKISILGAIGILGSDIDIEFLKLIEKKEANFSVRSKAHSSINAIAPDSIMPSKGLVNISNYTIPEDIEIKKEEEENFAPEEYLLDPISDEHIERLQATITVEEETQDEINIGRHLSNLTIDQSEEIPDNDSKPDVMKENQECVKKEMTKPILNEVSSKENETLTFDFLPFVVEEVLETETTDSEEKDSSTELNEIVVNFEEVTPKAVSKSKTKQQLTLEISEEEIAFLPIVTEMIEESYVINKIEDDSENKILTNEIEVQFEVVKALSQDQERLSCDYSEYNTPEILETIVIYDEIAISSNQISESNNNLPDPYFLSVLLETLEEDIMDVKSNANLEPSKSYENMQPQDEQKFKKIIKDLIDFNTNEPSKDTDNNSKNWPLLEFGDEFVNSSKVSETNDKEIHNESEKDTSEKDTSETTEETLSVRRLTIPKAILSDAIFDEIYLNKENTEESRMQLLDDLAAMGDERELPLLNELLINEKYAAVKDRVKRLIEKLSVTKEKPEQDTSLKPFNVFEDLFRTCDTEAKLILMDEIVAVGDEGEIDFLEGLLEHEEKEISNKAARVLEELKAKISTSDANTAKIPTITSNQDDISKMEVLVEEETLAEYDSLMEKLQIAPPQESEIFDLSFELTNPLDETTEEQLTEKSGNHESIFGQIWAISSKIIDKLNG